MNNYFKDFETVNLIGFGDAEDIFDDLDSLKTFLPALTVFTVNDR